MVVSQLHELSSISTEVESDAKHLNVLFVATLAEAPVVLELLLVDEAHHLWECLLHLLGEVRIEAHALLSSLVVLVVDLALLLDHFLNSFCFYFFIYKLM